jgi:MFS family permease
MFEPSDSSPRRPESRPEPAPIRRGRLHPSRLRGLLVDLEPVRRDRDFRMLWLGQLVSGLGRQVTVVALPLELWELTRNPLAIGLLAIVQLIPILVFALGGGAVADAVDRRRLLLVTQICLAATSAAFAFLAFMPAPPLWGFYVVAFVAAGIGAVDQPARSSAIPRLVPRERLQAAIAVNWLSFQTVAVAGPIFGGILVQLAGARFTRWEAQGALACRGVIIPASQIELGSMLGSLTCHCLDTAASVRPSVGRVIAIETYGRA